MSIVASRTQDRDHNWSGISISGINVSGDVISAFRSKGGTAIQIEGGAVTSTYVQSIKVCDSWLAGNNVVILGSWWQRIFFHTRNIGGGVGVLIPASQTGDLVQLTISASIFFADFASVFSRSRLLDSITRQ
jgi:hypothetical protein